MKIDILVINSTFLYHHCKSLTHKYFRSDSESCWLLNFYLIASSVLVARLRHIVKLLRWFYLDKYLSLFDSTRSMLLSPIELMFLHIYYHVLESTRKMLVNCVNRKLRRCWHTHSSRTCAVNVLWNRCRYM
jgi:hypothetical protein